MLTILSKNYRISKRNANDLKYIKACNPEGDKIVSDYFFVRWNNKIEKIFI